MAQPWGWLMANYRFYILDKDDHVREPPQVFECPDDATAVEQAVHWSTDGRSRFGITLVASSGWNPSGLQQLKQALCGGRRPLHARIPFDDLRLLSAALSDALGLVQKSAGGPLTETETSDFRERLAANLFVVFDSGERDPAALKRAALKGVLWASRIEMNGAPVPSAGDLQLSKSDGQDFGKPRPSQVTKPLNAEVRRSTGRVPTSGTVSSA